MTASSKKIKFNFVKSKGKVMLEVFFNYNCVIQYELIPEGQVMNKTH